MEFYVAWTPYSVCFILFLVYCVYDVFVVQRRVQGRHPFASKLLAVAPQFVSNLAFAVGAVKLLDKGYRRVTTLFLMGMSLISNSSKVNRFDLHGTAAACWFFLSTWLKS